TDQRADDAWSLIFDGEPLGAPYEILGAPVLDLEIESDQPVATLIARLNDVAPDGKVTRVTYGVLNLTHRESHATPTALESRKRYKSRLPLNASGPRSLETRRTGLGLSPGYWPIIWPAPRPVTLKVVTGVSSLSLPLRRPRVEDEKIRFAPPEKPAPG